MASRSNDFGRETILVADGAADFAVVTAGVGACFAFASFWAGAPPCANAAVAARRMIGTTLFKSIISLRGEFQEPTSVCRFWASVNRSGCKERLTTETKQMYAKRWN